MCDLEQCSFIPPCDLQCSWWNGKIQEVTGPQTDVNQINAPCLCCGITQATNAMKIFAGVGAKGGNPGDSGFDPVLTPPPIMPTSQQLARCACHITLPAGRPAPCGSPPTGRWAVEQVFLLHSGKQGQQAEISLLGWPVCCTSKSIQVFIQFKLSCTFFGSFFFFFSLIVQLKMVSMHSEKPICAPPICQKFPQCHRWSSSSVHLIDDGHLSPFPFSMPLLSVCATFTFNYFKLYKDSDLHFCCFVLSVFRFNIGLTSLQEVMEFC